MTTKAFRHFSEALRADIEARFGNGEAFTVFDFYPLTEQHGKPHKSVTHTLRDMATKGLLEIVGKRTNPHGGGATKCYTVVPGAQLALKTPRDYQIEAAQAAHRTNLAGIKLHEIMNNITRARLSAKSLNSRAPRIA